MLIGREWVKSPLGEGKIYKVLEVEKMWNFEFKKKKGWIKKGKPFYDFKVEIVNDEGSHKIWLGTSVFPI